jgi:3-hydroxybutyryl-CoA dehydrogenase
MQLNDIKKVLVIGAGTMGQQIGFQCAAHGYSVTIYDVASEALARAPKQIEGYAGRLVAAGHLAQAAAASALEAINFTGDTGQAAAEADLVSESIPEDLALKAKVFAQFNQLCPARTIFTTNTSSLVPSLFSDATGRPALFAALHFHRPVWTANVADVMPHPGTSPQVVAILRDFARSINQIPLVISKENYGYVFNAMYTSLNSAAIALAANGVASIEDIDRSWMAVMKMGVGPLGMLDMVGLDTVWHITEYWANATQDPQTRKNAEFLKREYIDKGWLGVKSGRGFYTYPDPAYRSPDFLAGG